MSTVARKPARRPHAPAAAEPPPPHNSEAERAVLGACFLDNNAFDRAAKVLEFPDFYHGAHRRIFDKMSRLAERGTAIDLVTLREELARSNELDEVGPAYITALVDGVPRSTNVEHYARIVKDAARARTAIQHARTAIDALSRDPAALANGVGTAFAESFRRIVAEAHEADATADDSLSQALPDFMAATTDPGPVIIEQLIPGAGIVLPHGQPRARKSLITIHTLLAASARISPFELPRLAVAEPITCLYLTEEDHASEVKRRLKAMCAGLQLAELPSGFRVAVQKGVWLPDLASQDRVIREVERRHVRVIAMDPVRGVTDQVDKGPGDLAPFTKFLRRLMRETAVVPVLPHHDTKPRADGKADERPRAQRASGGGILSISECPIHIERLSEDASLVVPNHWKYQTDPPPIRVRFESDGSALRLIGQDVEAAAADDVALHERILSALGQQQGLSGNKVVSHVRARKDDVYRALERLAAAGKVDSVRIGRTVRWSLSGEPK